MWNFRDVTEQRRLQNELQHLAFHDSLTGLANRTLFDDHVAQALRRQARTGGFVGVAVIDLDGFKHINDSLGHQTGDRLLVAIADRFCSTLRDVDTIARLGGDEFAMLVDGLDSPEQAGRIGKRILDSLSEPLRFADREVTIGASVGIALGTGAHEPARTTCSATPTPRCTAPRTTARAAIESSNPRCTPPSSTASTSNRP